MKMFERSSNSGLGNRLNFIDGNNIFVGYDYESCCCENFGYYITDIKPEKANEKNSIEADIERYNFDTSYCEEIEEDPEWIDCGGGIVFKMVADGLPDLYLVLYNYQNGYYSHGFEMMNGDIKLHDGVV